MTAPDDSGDDVSYHAELDFTLTFHSYDHLDAAFLEVGAQPPPHADGEQRDAGWPLVSPWSEFAHAHLDGLRLTGWCSGKLHDNYELRVQALASHADGHIDGIGEDVWIWRDRLTNGHVERHLGQRTFPTDTTPTQNPPTTDRVTRLDLDRASEPRGRIELVVAAGLDRIVAIPWIADHAEEVNPCGRDSGTITLTGVAGIGPDTLTRAAPDAVWQAFCGIDTATPNRWIGHHPHLGAVEGQHVDGQLVVPYPRDPDLPGIVEHSSHLTRLDKLIALLDHDATLAADVPATDPAADALATGTTDPLVAITESRQDASPDPRPPAEPPTRSTR